MSELRYADPAEFDLPYLDADPISEAGLILLGLDAERILAMLGFATLTADPGAAVLVVDSALHNGEFRISFSAAVAAGGAEWRRHRPAFAAADGNRFRSGSPREAWAAMYDVARAAVAENTSSTTVACLAACWFRREEIDQVTHVR
ncbi:DUF6187 family protein [Micromonospora sp. 4G57]|uniref:DUF6187 family protein n=1 Tax=Micromonospora sicca TaxID=2202420 RepID=A0ABU5JB44_9ACTN|nr:MULTISPECIES: DUF6187 family protein [unclassified Micromonospora]MDZ5444410.1 DUF6187 family protein [Micromonospora sp. 4G57]MDZ5489756.1 DUF6187 family protein [Micromonospora sp. 4G53]